MIEMFKIEKIEYLYNDIEFSNLQIMVNVYLKDDDRLKNKVVMKKSINKFVLETLYKIMEIPKHMIDTKYFKD